MRAFCLVLLLTACSTKPADSSTTTTTTTTATTTTSGTTTSSTTTSPVTIGVNSAHAECGQDIDTGAPAALTAAVSGPGVVLVEHRNFQRGCCPTFAVTPVVDPLAHTIDLSYTITDLCDCVCMLQASYTLTQVPSGTWTLHANSEQTSVDVP